MNFSLRLFAEEPIEKGVETIIDDSRLYVFFAFKPLLNGAFAEKQYAKLLFKAVFRQ